MSALCLGTLRRGVALAYVAAAWLVACGVPDYNIQEKPDAGQPPLGTGGVHAAGGSTATATGGSTAATSGASSIATGGQPPDPFNCPSSTDCTSFTATKVCDTSTNRCVECLPSVTDCGDGLYCGSDKVCHVGCASDSDCGNVPNCDASTCDALKCDTTTHECKGCLSDADCDAGTVCEEVTGTCVAGCSNSVTCPKGWTCCSQACVNLQSDAKNCASCSSSCDKPGANVQCLNGTCRVDSCKDGYLDCNNKWSDGCEVDKSSDSSNCNACGTACTKPQVCKNGACRDPACDAGYADCDNNALNGCETNLQTDPANCSSCGKSCDSTNGTPGCSAGTCKITCTAGFADCDNIVANGCEVNLKISVSNCSACGKTCPDQPNGTAICKDGTCDVSKCAPPYGNCDDNAANGCESDENNDPVNCGGCGNKCAVPNATQKCTLGVCGVATCSAGFADCDGDPKNGCEVNLNTDTNNCKACGAKCAPANAVGSCVGGTCTVTSCTAPFQDCNKDATDGCEANTSASVADCGKCGSLCSSSHGTPSCSYGACSIVCAQGFGNCDGDVSNGCEATTTNDSSNCGICGNACVPQHGVGACVNSSCTIASCSTGFDDCNKSYNDGCEARLTTDSANCGSCNNVCSSINGNASCTDGMCSIACASGSGNCDTLVSNGCEVDLSTSLPYCGSCSHACAPANATGAACIGSNCTFIDCVQGFGNCNAIQDDGCEANLMTDPLHCGKCSPGCSLPNAIASCNSGNCAIFTCTTGFLDCNGIPADGCEVNVTAEPAHCGNCSKVCNGTNGTAGCNDSVCGVTCNTGFGNCDGDASNGCEVNLKYDANNCNGCGPSFKCPTGGTGTPVCTNGSCGFSNCPTGSAECDGNAATVCETNVSTDVNNCGACTTKCNLPNVATNKCAAGVCGIQTCVAGYADCDNNPANGCEVDLGNDANNCGGCGATHKCSTVNGTPACNGGVCSITCNAGYGDCTSAAGCETLLNTVTNCGTCGKACSTNNGTASCTAGACGITCNSGFSNCDSDATNGCETNLNSPAHCGSCSNVCSSTNGTATCPSGTCVITCNAGYGDCTTAAGCETQLNTVSNCGTCGKVCNSTNGTAACTSGTCSITCRSGFGNCINGTTDGCETIFASDAAHCGNCATACTYSNATGVCNSGICQFGSCNTGYGNCDGTNSNGCESALNTATNCISCSVICQATNATTVCTTGGATPGCTPTCNSGYASCDSNPNNGCEQNIATDVSHCGSCTNACSYANATPTCLGGACSMGTCTYGYADCTSANGCETSVSADINNCGSCGNVCGSAHGTPACSNGACSITCAAHYANCDGNFANGCEAACDYGCTNGVCNTPCSTYSDCTGTGKSITVLPSAPSSFKPTSANVCYEWSPSGTINGGNCANFGSGNTMQVNEQTMTCGANWPSIPAKVNGGYCFHGYNTYQANSSTWTTW